MSDDLQEPNSELEAKLPVEHAEELESDTLEQDQRLDGSDEFAEVEQVDSDDAYDDGDVEAFDYDGGVEIADNRPQQKPKRKRASKHKDRAEAFAGSSDFSDEFDVEDDSAAGGRAPKHEYSGAAKFAPQRLAKILAAAGIDARRKCEEYVTTGRVTVDGEVITDVAFRADPYSQKIELDGEKIKVQRKVYFALNKPRGVVCTNHDPAGRPRVIDLFPQFRERIFAIGRLDEESEGLLLVTNDGELANRMAHPRYRVSKFYLCHVKGIPTAETLASLKRGMYFEEGRFHVEGVRLKKAVGDSAYLEIVLNEGQNREIRRLMAKVGHKVMRLKRVGFGPIRLGDLPSGAFRQLSSDEMKLLQDLSEQRAYLDKTAGRGRKKNFGNKPAFGSKPKFGSRPPLGKPTFGKSRDGAQTAYGDRPPRRKLVSQPDDEVISTSIDDEAMPPRESRGRRPYGGPRSGGYSQGENGAQSGQRRYARRGDNEGLDQPPRGQRRPSRREDSQEGQRGGSRAGGTGYGQGGSRGRTGYGQGETGNRRRESQEQFDYQQGGYASRPPRSGYGADEGERRPPRRYQDEQANQSSESDFVDNDFGGGRRRFVTDETPESSFNQRPARPPRPAGGARPQRRRDASNDAAPEPQRSGGYSEQRRPARRPQGPRGYGQAGNRELPARGRGKRPAPPPRPMTPDGKEILQGKVTGYRTAPKEGLARRRRKAIDGMQVNRKQRQQRRKKSEE